MPTRRLVLSSSLGSLMGCSVPNLTSANGGGATLTAYASEAESMQALTRWRSRAEGLQRARRDFREREQREPVSRRH